MAKHLAKCPKCGEKLTYESSVGDRIQCASCGAVLKAPGKGKPTDPLVGQTFGEFEITGLLGRGGMGAVYKAHQESLGRDVAIKVLPKRLAENPDFVERFRREARSAAAIAHPNIIEVFAIGEHNGHQYIAMECVEGETLSARLKREGKLPPADALEILKQVASALEAAHEKGILHRDIKPGNILFTSRGRAKVADFGLAKQEGVDVSVTQTGASLGTPLYMPPEIARGQPADSRSDLYSLGATFYQALAGVPPFDGSTPAELIVQHIEKAAPPLQSLAPDASPALCRAVHKLLRKKPAERTQSAAELLTALERVETRSIVGGASLPREKKARDPAGQRRPAHRRKDGSSRSKTWIPLSLILVVAVVLVVGLVFALSGGEEKPKPHVKAPPGKTVAPTPRTKTPTDPTTKKKAPAPEAAPKQPERDALALFKDIQRTAKDGTWLTAETYLARFDRDYARTKFYSINKVAIEGARGRIAAALKKPEQPKPPVKPVPDDDARWGAWEDLFDGKTLDGWQARPEKNRRIDVQPATRSIENFGGLLVWKGPFPTIDYEVSMETRRMRGNDFANLRFPVDDMSCNLVVKGDHVGLNEVRGPGIVGHSFSKGVRQDLSRWHSYRLRALPDRIRVWVDEELVLDFRRDGHQFRCFQGAAPFSFYTFGGQGAYRNIRLRRLKPQDAPVAAGPWKVYMKWPFDGTEATRRQPETAKALA
ncbi:protein kinase, partial [bacterium]|nr:protein kinase [bacterium]